MRLTASILSLASVFSAAAAHAADAPTQPQLQALVDAGVAKNASPIPMAFRVTSVKGCLPSPEVAQETVCLVGMSAGMRDGYMVLPLRQENGAWVAVERKDARFPGPAPAEALAMLRSWAREEMAKDPAAANDRQMQEAATSMQIASIGACEVARKTGQLDCDVVLAVPGQASKIDAKFSYAFENGGWRYLPRK